MKLRLALSALVYAVALSIGALIVTGHLSLTPFGGGSQQVMALENDTEGSSFLLCGGCYQTTGTTYRVTVTVTVRPNYVNPCNWGCNTYNPCSWGCYQPVYNYNPCSWGCSQQPVYNYNYWNNGCNWGCDNAWQNQNYLYGACHFNCNGRW